MEITYFFPTPIWSKQVDFDNNELAREVYEYRKHKPNQSLSNVGGYQGDLFHNQKWLDMVARNIPQREDKPLKDLIIYPVSYTHLTLPTSDLV